LAEVQEDSILASGTQQNLFSKTNVFRVFLLPQNINLLPLIAYQIHCHFLQVTFVHIRIFQATIAVTIVAWNILAHAVFYNNNE